MKRLFTKTLLDWKNNPERKPLLVYGARQVGKTTNIFKFATDNYDNVVLCNFERNEPLQKVFDKDLDPKRIIMELEVLTGKTITKGSTLLFFDEIQDCSKAITSVKYFYEQAQEYHIIAAGSLLGVALNKKKKKNEKADENKNDIEKKGASYPVGKVTPMTVYQMTFQEFLMEINPQIMESIKTCFETNEPMSAPLHDKALELYRTYLFVGGMPKAVLEYSNKKSPDFVRAAQSEILSLYYSDTGKYCTPSEQIKINAVYDSIPYQLAKENKKFQYQPIGSNARAATYEEGLHWLINAGVVQKINKVNHGWYPLSNFIDGLSYKVYMNDVGLLNAKSNISFNRIMTNDLATGTKGGLAENYIAAELVANGLFPFYWESDGKAELDFVVQIGDDVVAIEGKSADNTQAKSLNLFVKKYEPKHVIRISTKNFGFEGGIKSVPLYAVWCIR